MYFVSANQILIREDLPFTHPSSVRRPQITPDIWSKVGQLNSASLPSMEMMQQTTLGYDILAIDVDGTLLDSTRQIPQANRDAIQRALAAGIEVVLCTGRSLGESEAFINDLGLPGTGIFVGGAVTVDLNTGTTIRRSNMDLDLVRPLARMLNESTGHFVLLLKDRSVAGVDYRLVGTGKVDPASEWWFEQVPVMVDQFDSVEHDPHPHDTIRISIVATAREIRELAMLINQDFGDRTFLHDFPVIAANGNGRHLADEAIHLMEIFRHDTNKWTALHEFAKSQDVPVARVAAIGDEVNDLDMIRHAGLGIAMDNGVVNVKQIADQITLDHNNGGVAHAIDQILDGAW